MYRPQAPGVTAPGALLFPVRPADATVLARYTRT
jgi:hypothetical protein